MPQRRALVDENQVSKTCCLVVASSGFRFDYGIGSSIGALLPCLIFKCKNIRASYPSKFAPLHLACFAARPWLSADLVIVVSLTTLINWTPPFRARPIAYTALASCDSRRNTSISLASSRLQTRPRHSTFRRRDGSREILVDASSLVAQSHRKT